VNLTNEPLAVDSLLTTSDLDEIDRELDEQIEVDPHVSGTNNRRSDKELARMLELIDNLLISDEGKDGHA
jgi:hypothetical protein